MRGRAGRTPRRPRPPILARVSRPSRLLVLLVCAVLATVAAGCGGGSAPGPAGRTTRLVLDFTPNAVHAGVYLALDRDYDGPEGLDLQVAPPGSSTDALKTLLGHRADVAILDIHDLALARERHRDLVAVAPVVQVPLAAVIAQPDVRTPRDLEGRRVGVTGVPSDDAVLDTVVRGAGGDPAKVRRTTIGFNAVGALLGDKVAGATAFWNAEGLAVRTRRPGTREFRVDRYGAPSYPELVIAARATTLQDEEPTVRALVDTLRRGYTEAIADPDSAVAAMVRQEPGLDARGLRAQLAAVSPAFTTGVPAWGIFVPAHLKAWARWEARVGIVRRPPDVARMFWLGGSGS